MISLDDDHIKVIFSALGLALAGLTFVWNAIRAMRGDIVKRLDDNHTELQKHLIADAQFHGASVTQLEQHSTRLDRLEDHVA